MKLSQFEKTVCKDLYDLWLAFKDFHNLAKQDWIEGTKGMSPLRKTVEGIKIASISIPLGLSCGAILTYGFLISTGYSK